MRVGESQLHKPPDWRNSLPIICHRYLHYTINVMWYQYDKGSTQLGISHDFPKDFLKFLLNPAWSSAFFRRQRRYSSKPAFLPPRKRKATCSNLGKTQKDLKGRFGCSIQYECGRAAVVYPIILYKFIINYSPIIPLPLSANQNEAKQ